MKREYSKPDIFYEGFSLCSSIATDCEVKTETISRGTCGMKWDEGTVFLTGVSGCKKIVETDERNYTGICYHVPIETNNLFNS